MNDFCSPAQFESLFQRYYAPLCEVVLSIVQSRALAEEVVQDLFVVLWTQRDHLTIRGDVAGYLFTSARNRALTHVQHQSMSTRVLRLAPPDEPPGMSTLDTPVDEALERAELVASMHAAVASLPTRSRLAIQLRWTHQMSYAEVAKAMGISVKGVEKLLSIAMRHLRQRLAGRDQDVPQSSRR